MISDSRLLKKYHCPLFLYRIDALDLCRWPVGYVRITFLLPPQKVSLSIKFQWIRCYTIEFTVFLYVTKKWISRRILLSRFIYSVFSYYQTLLKLDVTFWCAIVHFEPEIWHIYNTYTVIHMFLRGLGGWLAGFAHTVVSILRNLNAIYSDYSVFIKIVKKAVF